MLPVVLVYLGLLITCLGFLSLLKPLAFLRIRNRPRGALVLFIGVTLLFGGFLSPVWETHIASAHSRLDEFTPVYQFHELHSIRINASSDRVYAAIKAVSADEIPLFRTLTWIRRLGRRTQESILNAPEGVPLLEVATRTSFLLLADEPNREIVLGSAVLAPRGWQRSQHATPDDFKSVRVPGFALASMNFLVEIAGSNTSVVTTETRVRATDPKSARKFARYWRVIYPGSALIRRMWLRAIKRRAEAPDFQPALSH